MRRVPLLLPFAALALALALGGCQKLFTTSVGEVLPGVVRTEVPNFTGISATDAQKILDSPNVSQEVLQSLLTSLNEEVAAGASVEVQALAAEAALGASGASGPELTSSIVDAVTNWTSTGFFDQPSINGIVDSLKVCASTAGVISALTLFDDPLVLSSTEMSSTELVMAALVIAAGAADRLAIPDYSSPGAAFLADPEVVIAKGIIAEASARIASDGGNAALVNDLANFLKLGS